MSEKIKLSDDDNFANIVSIDRKEKIGSGGFSNVYKIHIHSIDDKKEKTKSKIGALKFITCSQVSGLESLMESHIMRYISHPHINRAWGVQSDKNGNISITQPLALGDASSLIRKKMNKLSTQTLKRWLWELVTGLAKLHSNGILHGDIKAGNVLIFSNSDESIEFPLINPDGRDEICQLLDNTYVKINDFSLSRLISVASEGTFDLPRYTSYTSTHRPIEVWKGNKYSYPADIWALGCTFYEIAYGNVLFQDQSSGKNREMECNISAFEEWANRGITPKNIGRCLERNISSSPKFFDKLPSLPVSKCIPIPSSMRYQEKIFPSLSRSAPLISIPSIVPFKKCVISIEWENKDNEILNDLILKMLNINPNQRLTIWDIIDHQYFDDLRPKYQLSTKVETQNGTSLYDQAIDYDFGENNRSINLCQQKFPNIVYTFDGVSQSVINEAKSMIDNSFVTNLGISLYQRVRESIAPSHIQKPSLKGCILAANKLLYRGPPISFGIVGSKYLDDEINLCLLLNYRLLPHTLE